MFVECFLARVQQSTRVGVHVDGQVLVCPFRRGPRQHHVLDGSKTVQLIQREEVACDAVEAAGSAEPFNPAVKRYPVPVEQLEGRGLVHLQRCLERSLDAARPCRTTDGNWKQMREDVRRKSRRGKTLAALWCRRLRCLAPRSGKTGAGSLAAAAATRSGKTGAGCCGPRSGRTGAGTCTLRNIAPLLRPCVPLFPGRRLHSANKDTRRGCKQGGVAACTAAQWKLITTIAMNMQQKCPMHGGS